jgi:hypothetical protein
MPREIIQSTELEEALERQAYWNGITIAVGAGMPLEILLKQDGWTDAQLAELKTVKDEKVKQQQALFAQQGPVGNNPNANNNNNNNNNPPNQDNNQPMNNTDMQRQMQGRAA